MAIEIAAAEQHAAEDVAAEVVGAEPVAEARALAAVGEVDGVGRVGRQQRRHGGDQDQRGQRHPGALHAVTRGSSQACTTSATRLKTITASELTISIAISTV